MWNLLSHVYSYSHVNETDRTAATERSEQRSVTAEAVEQWVQADALDNPYSTIICLCAEAGVCPGLPGPSPLAT
jgi:hypothetical protein